MAEILAALECGIAELECLADEIWHEYFPCILTNDQINYMVNEFQSEDAIRKQIAEGYQYYFIISDKVKCGYICIRPETDALFLSKLYIKKSYRGRGIASYVMKFIDKLCFNTNLHCVYLHVNKYNQHSIDVYQHFGFSTTDSVVGDIGNGYVMDDYIMKKCY